MSNQINQIRNIISASKIRKNPKLLMNLDKNLNSNIINRRIESANTNFTSNIHSNIIRKNNNFANQSNSSANYSGSNNFFLPKTKKKLQYKPKWKYSYFLDKNDILSLKLLNNNPEIKNILCDYKDIDKKPKPIVYSWTKPRMIKIIENNALIEEDVKSHFWKYSHLFENNTLKQPGKLLQILMTQFSQGYEGGVIFKNYKRPEIFGEDRFNNKGIIKEAWRVPGIYRNDRNAYEPIKLKRPKSSLRC